jgi:hypothetical protein
MSNMTTGTKKAKIIHIAHSIPGYLIILLRAKHLIRSSFENHIFFNQSMFKVENGVKDVVVLEARDRLGGRVYTVKHDGVPLDLGAQWIHGGCPANSLFNFGNRYE